ncbi:MAG: PAS domain S-box protein [Pirellulales bacterium]|nr:PAS domain S-box protein [Pirellulales bacterium]
MSSELLDRFRDLQAYVGWSDEDAARIESAAPVIQAHLAELVDDFHEEIQQHTGTLRVVAGGLAQIERMKASLGAWLGDSLRGQADALYVERRWQIGLRHAELGLNSAFMNAAMARLRNGVAGLLARHGHYGLEPYQGMIQSFNKLLDLDLAIMHDAYEHEYLRREKMAEHERGETKFRKLVEAAACLVVIVDSEGAIVYYSPYSERLTGYKAREVLGKRFVDLFVAEAARGEVDQAMTTTLAGKPADSYEVPILHRDGRRLWFVWNAQRLDDFEGRLAVLGVGQDVTQQREALERSLRSERLAGIGQMITGIAHESRNALQRIQSCTEMLELEMEGNTEARRLLRRLQAAQDNLLRLFDEVRGFAAPIQLETALCHINFAWREAWNLLENVRRDRQASLHEDVGNTNLQIPIDRFQMTQVFRNLLENSLAACQDPVVVEVVCQDAHLHAGPALEIRIRDNGPGLSPAVRQSVFEPFFTTKTKGTGLGMPIARRIVEAHGGQIAVGNGTLAAGAEFIITLPRKPA